MAKPTARQIAAWAEGQAKPACKPKYRRLTSADKAYILRLREQKLTQAEIAQRIGCTQQAVSEWLRQCQDSTAEASLYLKGSALRMAQNIVKRGLARDHVAALKGIKVLEDDGAGKGVNITVNGFALVGMPTFASQVSTVSTDIHKLSGETESDNS